MNDSALKEFCIWAREELRSQVAQRLQLYGITAQGYGDASINVIGARVLSEDEVRQRKELIDKFLSGSEEGYEQRYEVLVERAAYTWFNRLAAIRYMEVNGLLPSGVRMLSAVDGSFAPQALRMAGDIDIAGVERVQVARLVAEGDDERLFRYLLLAQCAELADAMPDVFEPIGSAMELLLTDGLLRSGSVVERLVTAIPESDWKEGVEIVGWMYQYYNAQRKDEVFASFKKGKKAEVDAIAPATQLFTPHWIVRYLVENSLGRLWMRSHPDSSLVDSMLYYIPDESDTVISTGTQPSAVISTGGAQRRSGEISPIFERSEAESRNLPLSPESITVVDPACGSGHILTYCFDLLMKVYAEAGYTARDAVQSVLENNLSGIEIDPRAAELASFALAMKACEYDSRYLSRGTRTVPRVTCLVPVQVEQRELDASMPYLADRAKLFDAMEHINECGSLFVPSSEDLAALDRASEELNRRLASGDLLAYALNTVVGQMKANCEPLARTYDVVVANPPYMGSSNMDKWLANWTKKTYPDSKRDLCTCFIERGFTLANPEGYSAMITMQSWMFLSNAEALRSKLLKAFSIETMAHLGARAFDSIGGEVVSTTATVFKRGTASDAGSYVRLVDYGNEAEKQTALEEAIANPDCGWFHRRSADAFSAIPGSPIAYWASEAVFESFKHGESVGQYGRTSKGIITGNNDLLLRLWWESELNNISFHSSCVADTYCLGVTWFACTKGGPFRKWIGNNEWVVNWRNNGAEVIHAAKRDKHHYQDYADDIKFSSAITWTDISSGIPSFRYTANTLSEHAGMCLYPTEERIPYLLALMNSRIAEHFFEILSPTLHFNAGEIERLPVMLPDSSNESIGRLAWACMNHSRNDESSFETSWDFQHHPMVGD